MTVGKPAFREGKGNQEQLFQIGLGRIEPLLHVLYPNYPSFYSTLKALGFCSQYSTGEGGFTPICKIRFSHPRELKLSGLIAYIMFHRM